MSKLPSSDSFGSIIGTNMLDSMNDDDKGAIYCAQNQFHYSLLARETRIVYMHEENVVQSSVHLHFSKAVFTSIFQITPSIFQLFIGRLMAKQK